MALIVGYGVTTLISVVAVLRSDWKALVIAALARSETALPTLLPTIAETLSEPETEECLSTTGGDDEPARLLLAHAGVASPERGRSDRSYASYGSTSPSTAVKAGYQSLQ